MRHLLNQAPQDQQHSRCVLPTQLIRRQVLTTVKRGVPLHSPLLAAKVEGTPHPLVKVEASPCPTDIGSHQREEEPSYEQSVAVIETDSDIASEVDDRYAHSRVCDKFQCYLGFH